MYNNTLKTKINSSAQKIKVHSFKENQFIKARE